ncbi:MAG: hypothetical protein GY928_32865 [Colwellia sp.]|nr:hypothetical protein [Colwellia sp.]
MFEFNPYEDLIFFDSCAFDGGDLEQQGASIKALEILDGKREKVILMHSVVSEIRNPNTPDWLKDRERRSMQTVRLNLTNEEQITLGEIERIVVGNGSLEKRKADCFHVFEAQKYGGCFVTSDKGIYKHSDVIKEKYGLNIVRPSELVDLLIKYGEIT